MLTQNEYEILSYTKLVSNVDMFKTNNENIFFNKHKVLDTIIKRKTRPVENIQFHLIYTYKFEQAA